MTQALSTIVEQSAFAKQNMTMGDLFSQRLQDIFVNNLGSITVTGFSTKECPWAGIEEDINFTLPDGRKVRAQITTPKEK